LSVEDAKDDNLLVKESTVYVNALWDIYRPQILLVNGVTLVHMAILFVYIVLFPYSKLMVTILAASCVFVILLETIQMKNRKGYFSDFWNLIDLFGTGGLMLHAGERFFHNHIGATCD